MAVTNRREAMKLAAGLALAAGVATEAPASGQEPKPSALPPHPKAPADFELVTARSSPEAFMLGDPVTFKIKGDGYSRDLVITSALDESGKPAPVYVRSSSVRVFRADAGVDDFTKSGGLHWRFHDKTGKVRLPSAGEIVMIVREGSSHSSHSATRRPCAGRGRIAALSRLR